MADSIITQVDRNYDQRNRSLNASAQAASSSTVSSQKHGRGCLSGLFNCFGSSSNSNNSSGRARSQQQAALARASNPPLSLKATHTRDAKVYLDIRSQGLLPVPGPLLKGKKTLVLDLDETLVHSSFKPVPDVDFIVPVEIDGTVHNVYVLKRPGVDEFMQRMGELYEIVVFTASLGKYANPVLDILDIHNVVHSRLFREACVNINGNFVKDLTKLGRQQEDVIIVDNSPMSYMLQPQQAVPIRSWFDDPDDQELYHLIPALSSMASVNIHQTIPAVIELQDNMMAYYKGEIRDHWSLQSMSFAL